MLTTATAWAENVTVTSTTTAWTNGNTYNVTSDVTITERITVTGDVTLNLGEGCTLTAEKGITVLQDAVEDCDGVVIGSISGDSIIADEDIPKDLDVLVTHMPPYGILDEEMGSLEILNFVLKSKPKYHLFGHIHATAGQEFKLGQTLCRNISVAK
jgi:hypothetical protein